MRLALVLSAALVFATTAIAGSNPPPVETHVVATGQAPCGIAADAGALWVGVYGAGKLLRLDARSGRVTRRISVGASACRIALAGNAAWVTRDRAGKVVRVDLRTGRQRAIAIGGVPFDVLHAAGAIWVTSFDTGTVVRLDSRTGRLHGVSRVGESPAGLAYCGGRVWVGHGRTASWLSSIHPTTLRVRRVLLEGTAPGWPECIRGALWVTTPDSALRLDARTGQGLSDLRLGETLADAAMGPDDLVWVTDKQHSIVYRVDPAGRFVSDSFPAGPGAFALARAGDAMWITSFAGADIRRYSP